MIGLVQRKDSGSKNPRSSQSSLGPRNSGLCCPTPERQCCDHQSVGVESTVSSLAILTVFPTSNRPFSFNQTFRTTPVQTNKHPRARRRRTFSPNRQLQGLDIGPTPIHNFSAATPRRAQWLVRGKNTETYRKYYRNHLSLTPVSSTATSLGRTKNRIRY